MTTTSRSASMSVSSSLSFQMMWLELRRNGCTDSAVCVGSVSPCPVAARAYSAG